MLPPLGRLFAASLGCPGNAGCAPSAAPVLGFSSLAADGRRGMRGGGAPLPLWLGCVNEPDLATLRPLACFGSATCAVAARPPWLGLASSQLKLQSQSALCRSLDTARCSVALLLPRVVPPLPLLSAPHQRSSRMPQWPSGAAASAAGAAVDWRWLTPHHASCSSTSREGGSGSGHGHGSPRLPLPFIAARRPPPPPVQGLRWSDNRGMDLRSPMSCVRAAFAAVEG